MIKRYLLLLLLLFSIFPLTACSKNELANIEEQTDNSESEVETRLVTSGPSYESIKKIWSDYEIVEVYKKDGTLSLVNIYIYTSEETPQENTNSYFDTMLSLRTECMDEFKELEYIDIFVHFKARDFTGSLFFFTELSLNSDGDMYSIRGFMSPEIINLSDSDYLEAIDKALEGL